MEEASNSLPLPLLLEEEDDVVACHRQQIEDNMALVQVNPSPSPLASLIALLPL